MLQARGFDAHSEISDSPPKETAVNRFPYGWRYVLKPSPTGEECYDQIPLTAEDLRHPQLEDQVPQRNAHFQAVLDLAGTLKTYYAEDPNIVVEEGTRPCLVIEVTSPGQPGDDTTKVTLYARAGIPEYFLIKPHLEREVPYYKLSGYRLESGVYQPLVPDAQGRLLSQTLQFWLGVEDDGRLVRVTEAQTGQRWLTPTEMKVARQQEQAARLAAEARAQALAAKLRALGIDPG